MQNDKAQLYLGLISGTSADGVDAAVVEIHENSTNRKASLIGSLKYDYPANIKQEIVDLCTPTTNEIDRLGELDVLLGEIFAKAALNLLEQLKIKHDDIVAIGSHGQTIRHRPAVRSPFTLQIGDANTIAEKTGITTVADFRRRDMAAKGQGAPLAPAFHEYLFSDNEETRCLLNVGGIANITVLKPGHSTLGYDTGPGNGLMDAWINAIQKQAYDHSGQWAASGQINDELLKRLLTHNYFKVAYPKSTGREEFHFAWLQEMLSQFEPIAAADVQASLCELTALTIAQEIKRHEAHKVFVCGGGAHNAFLMDRLKYHLPLAQVDSSQALGIHPDWVEAACFAWLAQRTLTCKTGNLPSVTGAAKSVILGGIYFA